MASASSPEVIVNQKNCVIAGTWSGVLEIGALKLTLTFDISEAADGTLSAKAGCLEQGIIDYPADVIWQNGTLKFEIKNLAATYEGLFNEEKTEVNGYFTQNGGSFPLILKKGEKLIFSFPSRPQEPKPPYPYIEENVKYDNPLSEVTLAGTLTIPYSEKPCPAVLLIAGSGPIDRNETVFGHKPFLVLADHLTKQGIAVLRVDKRGVGESTGNYDMSTSQDFCDDVLAGIAYLKTRKEIHGKQIGLIGHSEGGIIAPMAAVKSNAIAFIVMMAGPAVTGEEILYEQGLLRSRLTGVNEEQILQQRELQNQMFSVVKNEEDFEKAEKQLHEIIASYTIEQKEANILPGSLAAMKEQITRLNSKWFRYFLTYDPATALKLVKVPVLALSGELDVQTSPRQNLPVIGKTLQEAGNADYTVIEFPKLNHLFQTSATGSITEYEKIEETIAPIVLHTLSEWILERTSGN